MNTEKKEQPKSSSTLRTFMMKKRIEILTLFFIVIGALNWGLIGLFNFNLVAFIAKYTFSWIENVIYVIVGVSALLHVASRNYYLSFLGESVFPCDSMIEKTPEHADTEVKIQTTPNANVVYWAAETHKEVSENPWIAYAEYSNAGVTRSDVNGVATLRFKTPGSYKVAHGLKTLSPHVHYRVCKFPGMLSEVQTVFTTK
jgi:uncharacterized membrane protein YuzA (DUF378 family)